MTLAIRGRGWLHRGWIFRVYDFDCGRWGFWFFPPGIVWNSEIPAGSVYACGGFGFEVLFIFVDPCAGRHLLSLLRQRK